MDHGKLLKLMQFLMGFDDIYQPIRSSLLTRETLHEIKDVFVIVSREESHRGSLSLNSEQVLKLMSNSTLLPMPRWQDLKKEKVLGTGSEFAEC
ncbi:hypothetical protein Tco_1400420 [Tanacetum coccineum]